MNILITGSKGFVGKNLVANLKTIKEGKNLTRPNLRIDEIFEYDLDTSAEQLNLFCQKADFVFNLAGINRPQDPKEFMQGNFDFASCLLDTLKKHKNTCPVMLSSSIQATLEGRYEGSDYGKSKKAAEDLFFKYSKETGVPVYVYRFPNLFGKWCKPNYNSAVATFCYNLAHDLPIQINDRNTQLELLYIDDLLDEMLDLLEGNPHRCDYEGGKLMSKSEGKFCYCPVTHLTTLGEIADLLESFKNQPKTLFIPQIPKGSLAKKLYSTYLSYLPVEKMKVTFPMHKDERGSFTELIKTFANGQFSVNISNPGITKGNHWHNTKWEMFIVVSGKARIEQRKIDSEEKLIFDVSGEKLEAIYMLPGYTHDIINLSETEPLITLMWVNETFDRDKPDTFFEYV